jgi:hypothetical protein
MPTAIYEIMIRYYSQFLRFYQKNAKIYEIKVRFDLIIYAIVTLNVRICIGFNVTLVACNDDLSKEIVCSQKSFSIY